MTTGQKRWYAVNMNREFDDWRVRDEENQDVLTLRFAHRADHARLAAAAPDLLVALEAMASLVARNAKIPWEVRAEAWRAIGKAKGESGEPF